MPNLFRNLDFDNLLTCCVRFLCIFLIKFSVQVYNEITCLLKFAHSKKTFPNIIRNLKNGKANGVDGITAEILKSCDEDLSERLSEFMDICTDIGEVQVTGRRRLSFQYTRERVMKITAIMTEISAH